MTPKRLASVGIAALAAAALTVVALANGDEQLPQHVSAAQQRYEQVRQEVGAECSFDAECPAPLRCLEAACAEPPAMVGGAQADTPSILFYGGSGEVAYYLEIVDDPRERSRGLMHRPSMLEDWGMIFVYPDVRPLSFWMQNTFIPLDMVFLDSDLVVVGVVAGAEPLTTTSRSVEGASQFVVELNAGQAAQHGIADGVRAELLNVSAETISSAVGD